MNEYQARQAFQILQEIEEFRAEKGISIPSDDREGNPEEGCLYGREYYVPEDTVTAILIDPDAMKTSWKPHGAPNCAGPLEESLEPPRQNQYSRQTDGEQDDPLRLRMAEGRQRRSLPS